MTTKVEDDKSLISKIVCIAKAAIEMITCLIKPELVSPTSYPGLMMSVGDRDWKKCLGAFGVEVARCLILGKVETK